MGAPLIRKLQQLQPGDALSHYKAMAMALRAHNYPKAAVEPLAKLLGRPGFHGHAVTSPVTEAEDSRRRLVSRRDTWHLNRCYRELIVASLLYQCGDLSGVAKSLLEQ